MSELVHTLTDGSFDADVIKASGPVLVDFCGNGCVPCKRLAPILDALAAEYASRVIVGSLNVHDHPDTAIAFQIRSIPTLLLFKDGRVVESIVGWVPKEDLTKLLDQHVPQGAISPAR